MADATNPVTATSTHAAADAAIAEKKAVDKAAADAVVAVDPHATHHIKLALGSPKVLAGTGTGALIGWFAGGPMGAAIGAGATFLMSRYQIAGDPLGKIYDKVTGLFHKHV